MSDRDHLRHDLIEQDYTRDIDLTRTGDGPMLEEDRTGESERRGGGYLVCYRTRPGVYGVRTYEGD